MNLDNIQYKIKEVIYDLENNELIEDQILDIINVSHFSSEEKLNHIRQLLDTGIFDDEECFKYIF